MTRETKAGIIVSFSFLCLVGFVLFSKLHEKGAEADLKAAGETQEAPPEPTPVGAETGKLQPVRGTPNLIKPPNPNGILQVKAPDSPAQGGPTNTRTNPGSRQKDGTGTGAVVAETDDLGPGLDGTEQSSAFVGPPFYFALQSGPATPASGVKPPAPLIAPPPPSALLTSSPGLERPAAAQPRGELPPLANILDRETGLDVSGLGTGVPPTKLGRTTFPLLQLPEPPPALDLGSKLPSGDKDEKVVSSSPSPAFPGATDGKVEAPLVAPPGKPPALVMPEVAEPKPVVQAPPVNIAPPPPLGGPRETATSRQDLNSIAKPADSGLPPLGAPRPGRDVALTPVATPNFPATTEESPQAKIKLTSPGGTPLGAPSPMIRAPLIAATPAEPAPATGAPQVESYDEETYPCQAGDSFRSISKDRYGSEKYERALLLFNRNHPLAGAAVQQEAPQLSGQSIYIPPARILDRYYASAIVDASTAAPVASLGVPGNSASTNLEPPSVPRSVPSFPTSTNNKDAVLKPIAKDKIYRVRGNDEMLWDIARRTLNDGERWKDVYKLNKDLDPLKAVPVGYDLHLPPDARLDTPEPQ
jgi:nucleoid-associated protein YgaU